MATDAPQGTAPQGHVPEADTAARRLRSVMLTGVLLGVGIVGFVDEAIFHQLLQWHTFVWGTDQHGRIFSDGVFHVVSTLALLWGTYRIWRSPHDWMRTSRSALLAAVLIGAGAFNAYDGVVQHLLLHLHLVNEYVCPNVGADNSVASCPQDVPFEVGWIVAGLALCLWGIIWWRRATRPPL